MEPNDIPNPLPASRPCEACGKETGEPDDVIQPFVVKGKLVLYFWCAAHRPDRAAA